VSGLHRGLIAIVGLALIFSFAVYFRARWELLAARRELVAVTTANEFLKKTLGDMTVAINAKDREIDRLENTGCDGQVKARPDKAFESDAVHQRNNHRMASAESETE
jgi:hypothetical protein